MKELVIKLQASRIKIKEWWVNLTAKEKQAVFIGGTFLSVFIAYECLWLPYVNTVTDLRQRVIETQNTLNWMQAANNEIKNINVESRQENPISALQLLTIIQKKINDDGLNQSLLELKQIAADSIVLRFQKVEFDKFIAMLITICREQNVTINQLTASADATKGIVNTEVILKVAA